MTIITFSVLLLLVSWLAGLIGALTGLGGGVIITPALMLLFHVNIHYAMGASLIAVIATSSGTSAAYIREGYTNLRIGMFLETAAVIGAFIGALLVAWISKTYLTIMFSALLFLSAYLTLRRKEDLEAYTTSHPWADKLALNGSYPLAGVQQSYQVQHVPAALTIMGGAGLLSGLLGIGSGMLKVLAMDQALRLPYKVSTTTSNFMMGITAAVSVGIYFQHGFILPQLAFPVLLGVLAGAFSGAKLLHYLPVKRLRQIFSIIIILVGIQLLINVL